jgi:predicted O-methyltransferase YrrM
MFWNAIFSSTGDSLFTEWEKLKLQLSELDLKRIEASFNTGSISQSTSLCLFSLSMYFKPRAIAEVGTFIGKSTLSLAKGMDPIASNKIFTCDSSNSIDLNFDSNISISQYKRKSSVVMFNDIIAKSEKIDMFFFDGRLTSEDLGLITKISKPESIYAFDDFEGVEKGTINSIMLFNNLLSKSHLLIYPPDNRTLVEFNQSGRSLLGVALPINSLRFVAQ